MVVVEMGMQVVLGHIHLQILHILLVNIINVVMAFKIFTIATELYTLPVVSTNPLCISAIIIFVPFTNNYYFLTFPFCDNI